MFQDFSISGSGGGGKGGKGGSGGGGNEANNTLQSNARARIAELISEGECEGIVDGLKGVFFDQTPAMNADGSLNFEGLIFDQRFGTPDQAHLPGLPMVETPYEVGAEVKASTGPLTRTILETNADAARVTIRVPALVRYTDDGDIKGTDLSYQILVRGNQGTWRTMVRKDLINQKTTSTWQCDHEVELPAGQGPWDIRLERITPDSDSSKKQNQLYWDAYSVITRGKFTYPNSAYAYLEVNAEKFGSSIPARSYRYRGLKIQVPSNYDPVTRVYTGGWNGTFKTLWSNNPAWIFYDLLTNDRYGLGEFVDVARIDKWTLYQIGKYCDEMVPSGFKNASGQTIYEPRFTYNGTINSRDEAINVLANVTNAFRGMAFWALGQVYAAADMPEDPFIQVNQTNVVKGSFKYSGTSRKARHSVCIVSYNDQNDFGRPAVEVVINEDTLKQYGWRQTRVVKHGCTSRGEAHRFGKWILDTEQNETETVEYTAGPDHAKLRPFHIIKIADPNKAMVRAGGRVLAIDAGRTVVTLDGPVTRDAGNTYWLSLTMPTGVFEKVKITGFNTDNTVVTVETPFSAHPVDGAVYMVSSTSLEPRQWRVLNVKENTEDDTYEITALFHDPQKYLRVEQGITLQPVLYDRPNPIVPAPRDGTVTEAQYTQEGVAVSKIVVSWTPGNALAARHMVTVQGPDGFKEYNNLPMPTLEIFGVVAGHYTFTIRSYGPTGVLSQPLVLEYDAHGWGGMAAPQILNLRTPTGDTTVDVIDFEILWDNVVAGGDPFYRDNIVEVYDVETGTLLRSEIVRSARYVYTFDRNKSDNVFARGQGALPARSVRFDVCVRDTLGRTSPEASLTITNPVPETPVPELKAGFSQIMIDWAMLGERDYAGTLVWVSNDPNFDPRLIEPTYDTLAGPIPHVSPPGQRRYVRLACYDTFGKSGLIYSAVASATAVGSDVDTEAPATPTALAAISGFTDAGLVRIVYSWAPNAEDDLSGYQLEVRQVYKNGTKSAWDVKQTIGISAFLDVFPGETWEARLLAYDRTPNKSNYTAILTHVAANDTVAPAVPTAITASTFFGSAIVKWTPAPDRDLAYTEIYYSQNGGAPGANAVPQIRVTGNTSLPAGLETGKVYFFWLRSVDTSGNKSDWSARVQATPRGATGTEIKEGFIATDEAFVRAAHIQSVYASQITVPPSGEGFSPSIRIGPNGTTIGSIANRDQLFDSINGDWTKETGVDPARNVGSLFYTVTPFHVLTGARSLVSAQNGEVWSHSPDVSPFDPSKLYKVTFRVIRFQGTSGAFYLGLQGLAADRTTLVNRNGDNLPNGQHYCVVSGEEQASVSDAGWTEFVGYVKGGQSPVAATTGRSTIASPSKMHGNVRFLRPLAIFNYGLTAGGAQMVLDSIKIDIVDEDVVAVANAGSSQFGPGTISLAGPDRPGTITDWRKSGTTEMDGDKIAANTIQGEKAVFGLRGIDIEGIQFEHNKPTVNDLSWTSGTIRYRGDDGNFASRTVSAAAARWTGGTLFVYFVKGASSLSVTTDYAVANGDDRVILAKYRGNKDLNVGPGQTVIDGSNLKTGTVGAEQIDADNIRAAILVALSIKASMVDTDDLIVNNDAFINKLTARQAFIEKLTASDAFIQRLRSTSITVGQSPNLIMNGDFKAGFRFWSFGAYNNEGGAAPGANVYAQQTPFSDRFFRADEPAWMIAQTNANGGHTGIIVSDRIAAEPGKRYQASAYFGMLEIARDPAAQILLTFYDASDAEIGSTGVRTIAAAEIATGYMGDYTRHFCFGVAPATTRYARIRIQKFGGYRNNSYLWIARAMLAEATAAQNQPSPFGGVGSTTIVGDQIRTGKIVANNNKMEIDLDNGTISIYD